MTRRLRVRKAEAKVETSSETLTDLPAWALSLLNEDEGYMCRDSSWPSHILKTLVAEGLAECEVRVGIPTYWKVASSGTAD
jgi:hypothetical protein